MKAEIIADADALQALEADWWRLWERQPRATPFSTPAWLIPWWAAFHPGALMSVAVWHNGDLAALAPLYLEHGPERRLLPLGISLSDYCDILIDPTWSEEAARTLLDMLAAQRDRWDLWSAEEAPPGAAVLDLSLPTRWSGQSSAQSACPVLALPDRAASLAGFVPPTMLRKWRMAQNRTARRHHAIESADENSLAAMLLDLFRLHEARWRSRGQDGVLLDGRVRGFHADAAVRLLKAGMLRLTSLRIDDCAAGLYYGFESRGDSFAYIGGFDPDFAFESPGTVLLGDALQAAVTAGRSQFHFLRGEEHYKFAWGATVRWNTRRIIRGVS